MKDDLTRPILYECERCGEVFGEYEWKKQSQKGRFRAENPGAEARGFHLNTLSSSFCGWKEVVEKFVLADEQRKQGDLEKLKAFGTVNVSGVSVGKRKALDWRSAGTGVETGGAA